MTCTEWVSDSRGWNGHECGRPVVEDGLCSPHLRVRARREAKDREREERRAESDHAKAGVEALCAELGITGVAEFSREEMVYTGRVIVTTDTLRGLADRTRDSKSDDDAAELQALYDAADRAARKRPDPIEEIHHEDW